MATHGRGALGRFWLGSVADEMLRHVNVPLLLVRPDEEAVDLAHEPALGRVVVALDGTPLAEQILEPAVALAALMPDATRDADARHPHRRPGRPPRPTCPRPSARRGT